MIKKTFVAAAVTAAALGTGGAAVASTQGSHVALAAPSSATASSAAAEPAAAQSTGGAASWKGKHQSAKAARRGLRKALRRAHLGNALHGTWVTKNGRTGAVVTHDAIRGTASAVSATSITVTAADKVTETYAVTGTTRVRVFDPATHKRVTSSVRAVKSGQRVVVVGTGTGTGTLTATRVVGLKTS